MNYRTFISLVLVCFISFSCFGQRKMTSEKLQADFDYLIQELREKHLCQLFRLLLGARL